MYYDVPKMYLSTYTYIRLVGPQFSRAIIIIACIVTDWLHLDFIPIGKVCRPSLLQAHTQVT